MDEEEGDGGDKKTTSKHQAREQLKEKLAAKFYAPLSAGHDSTPIGSAYVFNGLYPELFVANGECPCVLVRAVGS